MGRALNRFATAVFLCLCLVGAESLVGARSAMADPSAASKEPGQKVVVQKVHTKQSVLNSGLKTPARFQAGKAGIGRGELLTDPPFGGCDWLSPEFVFLQVTSYYTNGVLTNTDSEYNSKVQCFATAPGQTLAVLTDTATLDLNSVKVDEGNHFVCQSPPSTQCLLGSSVGSHPCAGQANCAGSYQNIHFTQMTLPDGWIWTAWPADLCVELDQQQTLICYAYTEVLVVPPTI